jgi:DNA-binding transcriptional LysR family regulator
MDLNNLVTFVEIAETGSFSRSAENLNLSQPAVSKRIAALETALTTKLFDRMGRDVQLTEYGELLLPTARHIQAELLRVEEEIGKFGQQVAGRLRLGTTGHVGKYTLPRLLKQLSERYPSVSIDLSIAKRESIISDMQQGQFELALVPMDGLQHTNLPEQLHSTEVFCEKIVPVVSVDHPLCALPSVSIHDLHDVGAILPTVKSLQRMAITAQLARHSIAEKVRFESDDFELIRLMVAVGLGWGCLPQTMVDDTLKELPVAELTTKHSVHLIRHRDRTPTRAADAFIGLADRKTN